MKLTRDQLRAAIAAVFYPRIPDWDAVGQDRIDRATGRVVDAIEGQR